MKLLTISLSHFCEKACWGLDRAGVAYTERGYAPALHRAAVMRRGSSTVPVLVREIAPWRQTAAGQHALAMYRDWR